MAIKIGHSAIDENGKIAGGSAGDQTGAEVCVRTWYNNGWNCVLRPRAAALAEKSAKTMEQACANNNIGYDQNQRNTLYTQAKANGFDLSKITTKCECDCSSLAHVCSIAGGAHLAYGSNGYTTRTIRAAFAASGDYEVLTDSKYLTSDKYLKRGDFLLKEGSHIAMALENGSEAAKPSTPTELTTNNIVAGKKITLKNAKSYTSESAQSHYGMKTGTFYLWDDVVKNGRIRITNAANRVGVKGQVTCWISVADIGLTTSADTKPSTPTAPTTNNIVSGKKITLKNAKSYTSESAQSHYGMKSGTFYLWDDVVKNGRIRITNAASRVGVKGQVTCWISVADI